MFFAKYQIHLVIIFTLFAYTILGYFFERAQFENLLILYSIAFLGFVVLMKSDNNKTDLFKIGLLFRIFFLVSTPFLSQDFFRFIWDGHLMINAINPYQYKPDDIINSLSVIPNSDYLYEKMGSLSAAHYSNYPPVNQLFFALASIIGGKSIFVSTIILRLSIILADVGIYIYGKKVLNHFNQNTNSIHWYFLNPLVIIELTGNLHFEGVMLFFLVLGFYFLIKNKMVVAAFFIAVSISTKLLPILLLPLFFNYLGFKKSILFYSLIIGFNILFFLPFINQFLIDNYIETISLWFTNFEFNASIYYLIREIGFYFKGYNIIQTVGKITPIITILMVLYFAFLKKNVSLQLVLKNALAVLTLYFFISTTVHPWYVINLVFLSIFLRFRFAIIWSYTVVLSYFAYSNNAFEENYVLLVIEYLVVISFIVYEFVFIPKKCVPNG